MTTYEYIKEALSILGLGSFLSALIWYLIKGGWKKDKADLSLTERQAIKFGIEDELAKLNFKTLLDGEIKKKEEYYKNIVFDTREIHYKEKLDWEKEREASLTRIADLEQKVKTLQAEVMELKKSSP